MVKESVPEAHRVPLDKPIEVKTVEAGETETFLLEIGTEELPVADLNTVLGQLEIPASGTVEGTTPGL